MCITRVRHPVAVSSADEMNLDIMVVDTVGTLHRATDAAWGWITEHMDLLGSGPARLLSSRPAPWHLRPGRLQNS